MKYLSFIISLFFIGNKCFSQVDYSGFYESKSICPLINMNGKLVICINPNHTLYHIVFSKHSSFNDIQKFKYEIKKDTIYTDLCNFLIIRKNKIVMLGANNKPLDTTFRRMSFKNLERFKKKYNENFEDLYLRIHNNKIEAIQDTPDARSMSE